MWKNKWCQGEFKTNQNKRLGYNWQCRLILSSVRADSGITFGENPIARFGEREAYGSRREPDIWCFGGYDAARFCTAFQTRGSHSYARWHHIKKKRFFRSQHHRENRAAWRGDCESNCVIADYSKINSIALYSFASFEDIDVLITDTDADKGFLAELENYDVEVLLAD